MFIKFNEEAQKILKHAKVEMQKLKHAFIGSEHLILSILNSKISLTIKLTEYGINYDNFKNQLIKTIGIGNEVNNYFIYTPLLKRVLENAIIDTRENNEKEITTETIFLAILDEGEGVGIRILESLGVNIDDLYEEMSKKNIVKKIPKKSLISEASVDLTKKALAGEIDPLIGREKEVNEIIEILLRKNKNNPLLIGEAGVGKTAIIEELANRIVKGMVPDKLKNNKIYSLSMASTVAGTKYRGEFEERVTKMLKELEQNDEVIVFIDEIHTIVGAGGAEGAIDASNILKPALARGKIKLIGATTIKEYKETICKDKALNRRFQTVMIKENTLDETKDILYKLKNLYEDYHHVIIPLNVIDELVNLTDKYIGMQNNPDKSIDILDMVCAKVSLSKDKKTLKLSELNRELRKIKKEKNDLIIHHDFEKATKIRNDELNLESKINQLTISLQNKKKIITTLDVAEVIESKTKIPVYEIKQEKKKLLSLEQKLKEKIIGQDEAIQELCKETKKIMLGFKNNLPSSFFLVGKSGVGKTMLVKEYSKELNIPLIRLDMSEYKESHTVSKIIGSPPGYIGYNDTNTILEKVKNEPYSILLLDEIEKSCPEVINLFLQILDEGMICDAHGESVSFKNTIIMMTSNLGTNKDNIGFSNNKMKERNLLNNLSTPFVNRLNKILYFNDLTYENIMEIVKKKIKGMKKKYAKYNINIQIDKKMLDNIIKESHFETYGARKVNKLIEEKLDDAIIDAILKGNSEIFLKS